MNTDVTLPVRDGIVELKRTLAAETDALVSRLPLATTAAPPSNSCCELCRRRPSARYLTSNGARSATAITINRWQDFMGAS